MIIFFVKLRIKKRYLSKAKTSLTTLFICYFQVYSIAAVMRWKYSVVRKINQSINQEKRNSVMEVTYVTTHKNVFFFDKSIIKKSWVGKNCFGSYIPTSKDLCVKSQEKLSREKLCCRLHTHKRDLCVNKSRKV